MIDTQQQLFVRLEVSRPCEVPSVSSDGPCACSASWSLAGMVVCDICLLYMSQYGDDTTRNVIHPALVDMVSRKARVRILYGEINGTLGTVYNYLPSRPAPWHVLPDAPHGELGGIALKADEMEVIA